MLSWLAAAAFVAGTASPASPQTEPSPHTEPSPQTEPSPHTEPLVDAPGFHSDPVDLLSRGKALKAGDVAGLAPADAQPLPHLAGKKPPVEGTSYQWRGLIWQSIEFNVFENGGRVASDPVMRDDLGHKPFWHDWLASVKQFNMRRWNDGDDFLVNYIGHSIHGAVAADIEMQNNPIGSRLEWGDPGYAKSRFQGFLWAVVYSTHSEISPAGEAGIGSEGGFTYGVHCQYHCNSSNYHPGDHVTNNTGWVDFIVTPTGGMVWVMTEDLLDKKISDRLVEAHPDKLWPKIVRGSLSPSRSFANMLRWQVPWYRDFEYASAEPQRVHWFPSELDAAWEKVPSFELAGSVSGFSIATNTAQCFNCRNVARGVGLNAAAHLRGWLSVDSAVSYHGNASPLPSDRAGGNMLVALFGLRATREWRYNAAHVAIRPGLVRFSQAYLYSPDPVVVTTFPPGIAATSGGNVNSSTAPGVVDANGTANQPSLGPIHHFLWNVNLSYDYKITRHLALRVGLDENLVRYRTDKVDAPGIGTEPYLSWLSKQNFVNRGNYAVQVGPVFSF